MQFLQNEAGLDARFINRATILVGEEAIWPSRPGRLKDEGALEGGPRRRLPESFIQRARELSREADCWMIGLMHPALAERLPVLFRDVRSYTYALTLEERSKLRVTLNMRSREAADRAGIAAGGVRSARRSPGRAPAPPSKPNSTPTKQPWKIRCPC